MRNSIIVSCVIALLLSCASKEPESKYTYKELKAPSEDWIGKTVQIEFGQFADAYAYKTFVVKIKAVKLDTTSKPYVKYFVTEQPYTNAPAPVDFIYYDWFETNGRSKIISYKEAIPIEK